MVHRHLPAVSRRRGFTLIELLVVIAVIALLASLLVVALLGSIGGGRETATEGTIRKIQSFLQSRIDAFNRFDLSGKELMYMSRAGNNKEVAKVLTRKQLFRENFPQTWADASKLLKELGQTAPTTINADTESAEVLFLALTEGRVLGNPPVGLDSFSTTEYADTDNNGRREFIDAWGKPLRYYIWPTRLLKPNGTDFSTAEAQTQITGLSGSTAELQRDPDDPLGYSDLYTNFETEFHTRNTYHTPLILSAGQDNETGLYEPGDTGSTMGRLARPKYPDVAVAEQENERTKMYDNITNLNKKSGGN